MRPSEVFEQMVHLGPKKIEFHIPAEMSAKAQEEEEEEEEETREEAGDSVEQEAGESGFGKLYPSTLSCREEEIGEEEDEIPSDFISSRELEKGRLSRDKMMSISVFKNYQPGEPTHSLYVKNIAKTVEEKDLQYIYNRYIDVSSEHERYSFNIVLMKEGRMKGQAFIRFPSQKSAKNALRDTNGYFLHNKPLVVQFARSSKPKKGTAESKTGRKKRGAASR